MSWTKGIFIIFFFLFMCKTFVTLTELLQFLPSYTIFISLPSHSFCTNIPQENCDLSKRACCRTWWQRRRRCTKSRNANVRSRSVRRRRRRRRSKLAGKLYAAARKWASSSTSWFQGERSTHTFRANAFCHKLCGSPRVIAFARQCERNKWN